MNLFSKTSRLAGWLAVNVQADGISLAHVRRVPAALPVVEFVSFYPADKLSAAMTMERLAKESQAGRHHCIALLTAGEYQLLSVDAPNVPRGELKTAIRWRLKDMLDFHIDDATIDVLDVPVDKDAPIRTHSMYVVAAHNQTIRQRQGLFESAKIPLGVIDIPEMAQRNIAALLETDGRGLALLTFDESGGLLTMTFAGELYLARRIDITLRQLVQADDEQKNILYERIVLELQRSIDHFDRQYRFITLARLVLSAAGKAEFELQKYLAVQLYISVEVLVLEAVLDMSKAPQLRKPEDRHRFLLTVGAALRLEELAL
ncbi:MAG: agglutinin biogenesis protein MshI [Pseudomonadota bacterium]